MDLMQKYSCFDWRICNETDALEDSTIRSAIAAQFFSWLSTVGVETTNDKLDLRGGPPHAWASSYEATLDSVAERTGHKALSELAEKSAQPGTNYHVMDDAPSWARSGLARLAQEYSVATNTFASLRFGAAEPRRAKDSLDALMGVLDHVWPEIRLHVERHVDDVFLIHGDTIRSCSAPYVFGGIFINADPDWGPVNYFDALLHETSHLSLYVKSRLSRLAENSGELICSPLRTDVRPVEAVLHAVFVLRRICEGMLRYRDGPAWLENKDEATQLGRMYTKNLVDGLKSLAEKASFTSAGGELFDTLQSGVSELVSSFSGGASSDNSRFANLD